MRSFILIPIISLSVITCLIVSKQLVNITSKQTDALFNASENIISKKVLSSDPGPSLKSVAKFPIGASVDAKRLFNDSKYADIITTQFNSITTENALKWNTIQPQENVFKYNKSDSIVTFALSHNMRVHGHVLVTVSKTSLPSWVGDFQGDQAAWEQMFKNHIQTEVSHFKGRITSWDVVNETFDDNGQIRSTTQSNQDGNIWLQHLGPDYTARAFQYAHEADPNALLFYNDNKQESSEPKLNAIISMVKDFKRRNIPIDGLGIQMHISINTPNEGIENALRRLAQTGLKIHISELDIRINPKNNFSIDSASALQAQADKYNFIAHAYSTIVPKAQQYGITFWNVTDKDSWIVLKNFQDSPLLFDKNYNAKPAFQSFINGLR